MRTIAFIGARGGSVRVKRKNVEIVGGHPLIAHTILRAQESGIFTDVIVNSEDKEILDIAQKYGAQTYVRPEALATGTTFVIQVIQEMTQTLKLEDTDTIGVLFPTVPLRTAEDIQEAYKIYKKNSSSQAVVSVCKYDYPIQLALKINSENKLEPIFPDDYYRSTRHNDHPDSYRSNFAIIFNNVKNLKSQKTLIGEGPIPFLMPLERSIDIDDPFQMDLIKNILGKNV